MPSFFVPARDSRHRAACLALYRALLRQVPHLPLPRELLSRAGWQHPIRYLLRASFERNRNDTSPRLITSALKSGYRVLTVLARAHDASSQQHAEIVAFLRERHEVFPPPKPLPSSGRPRERAPPLLIKVSEPGEKPLYKSNVRPRPLAELRGGRRKVPVFDETGNFGFLRIGKPQSLWHANFLKRKSSKRQLRITAMQELWDVARPAAAEEDQWEHLLEELADEEGVDIPDDVGEESEGLESDNGGQARPQGIGPFEHVVREFGWNHIHTQLNVEAEDTLARATAMLDIRDEEQRLADLEKRERWERRFRAWQERESRKEQTLGQDHKDPTPPALQSQTSSTEGDHAAPESGQKLNPDTTASGPRMG